jgi:potassium-dependent mechanosensitive channel
MKIKMHGFATLIGVILICCGSFVANAKHYENSVNFRKKSHADKAIVLSDSSLEALGIDSLLNKIEETHNTLTNIINVNGLGFDTKEIEESYPDLDSNITAIEANTEYFKNSVDFKNLQVFSDLLSVQQGKLNTIRNTLFNYDKELLAMNVALAAVKKDTLLEDLLEDSVFKKEYDTEIVDLQQKIDIATHLVAANLDKIKGLQVTVSNKYFQTLDLSNRMKEMLAGANARLTSKEVGFIWETSQAATLQNPFSHNKISVRQEKIVFKYLKTIQNTLWTLLAFGVVFFVWIRRNFIILIKKTPDDLVTKHFRFISQLPIFPAAAVIACIAPVFAIHPPTAYVTILGCVIVMVSTPIFFRTNKNVIKTNWSIGAVFYLVLVAMNCFFNGDIHFRHFLICLNVVGTMVGIYAIREYRKHFGASFHVATIVYGTFTLLNFAAIVCNVSGRISLAKMLTDAGATGLTEGYALALFTVIMTETLHLQTLVNRQYGGLIGKLNFQNLEKATTIILRTVAVLIWITTVTINLNSYDAVFGTISVFLTDTRKIGTMEFRIGNLIIFFGIIYVSNLFQQGVGSLYGKENSKWDPEIKKNASRLAMSRLILLMAGFLIAIAASGMPLDKITIVLGALGVGIGLGLQAIVNNLVSGVILIFEQPFRIGDFIEVNDKRGRVLDIGIRASKIVMDEGAEVIIPNGDLLAGRVINWTLNNDYARIEFWISVSSQHSFEQVKNIITAELQKEESTAPGLPPEILLTYKNEKYTTMQVFLWINHVQEEDTIKGKVLERIFNRFAQENIQLP